MREISVDAIAADTDVPVVDVREQDEWDAGHVPHAIHIPMGEIVERIAEVPDGVAVICHSGGRSARVVQYLESQGYTAANVVGGTSAWIAAGHDVAR
mgnify:FL=1